MSWLDAQSHCRLHYTDLASVRDMKDLLRLRTAADGLTDLWTGLHRTSERPKAWHWSQGAFQYNEGEAQWAFDQPDNYDGFENCVEIMVEDTWNDDNCGHNSNCFICYDEASSSPVMVSQSGDWLAAQQYCRKHFTDLVSGPDQHALFLQTFPVRSSPCWIGLSRDNWGWSDGSNSPFRSWESEVNPQTEKCASLRASGRWESADCGLKKSFVCHGELKTKKTVVKLKMSAAVDLNSPSPQILHQLQERLKANHLGHLNLSWKKDKNQCVFKKQMSSTMKGPGPCDAA
ncbi:unnamed protein product [Knipowitschia caucasica]|uniref:C-type lectin domain-containing protein n=1 Tax=Knipowitschia caucasica TaxID=637954 RepID=A0AAV2MNT4_KNICA